MVCEHVYMNISPPPPIIELVATLIFSNFDQTIIKYLIYYGDSFETQYNSTHVLTSNVFNGRIPRWDMNTQDGGMHNDFG